MSYDDVAGMLRVTWTYYDDIRTFSPGGNGIGDGASAGNPVSTNEPPDYASISWSGYQDDGGAWSLPTTLMLYGAAGSLTGTGSMSPDGRSVTAEFTHPTLVGRDWQRAFGPSGGVGDEFERFWFDGFPIAPPPPSPPSDVPTPPTGADVGPTSPEPAPGAPAGPTGMSINNGAQFTNDPSVTLAVIAPLGETTLRVANDGGFLKARPFPVARTIKWKLEESGSERLPKTVYLRFGSQSQTFTDDIILDQTKPTMTSASLVGSAAPRTVAATRAASKRRTFKVRVGARDRTSGVGKMQFAVKKNRPSKLVRFARVATVKGPSAPRFVRVQDRAGNYSRWRSVR